MTLLATLLPLLNFLLFVTFSRVTAVHWKHLATLVIVNMTLLLLALLFFFVPISQGNSYTSNVGSWLLSGLFEVNWVFSIDSLTYTMLLVVLTVSTLVHLYSTEYMSEDPHTARFISYLSLFTFFMLLLVTSNNFVGLFLGWEGVGLCSYLLISFWFTRVQANKAAIKAMVVNRVSDLFFTVGILVTFYTFQTVEFNAVFGLAPYLVHSTVLFAGYPVSPIILITSLLFLGAMGKSAQIGLHTWLPDAMEGPTPVSALIHAATMVTAGVFLIIRCSPLFEYAPTVLVVITVIGAGTAFMAATSGLLQNDLKKVIAYSTCSQLGYMIFVCGLSGYTASLFHLSTHAFFKALLFLSAGAVIHAVASEQDLRRFGGLRQLLPFTYGAFFVGSIALMGVPFLSGFYSKDLILEIAGGAASVSANFAYSLGLISAFFTSFYSFRLLHLAFYGSTRAGRLPLTQTHELSPRMAGALFVLALGTVFLGVFGRDVFVGPGTDFWNDAVAVNPTLALNQLSGEFLPSSIKQLPLFGVVVATALVFYTYDRFVLLVAPYTYQVLLPFYRFLSFKWGFDTVYNRFINKPLLQGAYNIPFSLIDKGLLEQAGPTGLGKAAVALGYQLTKVQTGRITTYGGVLLLSALLCVLLFAHLGADAPSVLLVLPLQLSRPSTRFYFPIARPFLHVLLFSTRNFVNGRALFPICWGGPDSLAHKKLTTTTAPVNSMQLNFIKNRPMNGTKPAVILVSNHFLYYPTPSSLNYNWSFGSLAGLFFALQLVTGIFLAMHYTPHVEWAFASVEHIMTDVSGGFLFRYFHANGASMIFILIYLHIGRNLYYQSYITRPVLWSTGIIIFLLMMATAFIGYVLPWGQMSFWGATVITSLVTAVPFVGEAIAHWVWGGFSISNATLVRFYALHFTLPFIVLGVIAGHLVALHTSGSSDPLVLATTPSKVTFHPYYTAKDAFIFFVVFAFFARLVCFAPNLLGHSDNFLPANPLVTPAHIVPEWYFTPFYAILRACPNKLGGAIGMFAAILLLFAVPALVSSTSPDALMVAAVHSTAHKVGAWVFAGIFLTLMYLGMRAAEAPYVFASKIFTGLYFSYFLVFLPTLGWLTRQLLTERTAIKSRLSYPRSARGDTL